MSFDSLSPSRLLIWYPDSIDSRSAERLLVIFPIAAASPSRLRAWSARWAGTSTRASLTTKRSFSSSTSCSSTSALIAAPITYGGGQTGLQPQRFARLQHPIADQTFPEALACRANAFADRLLADAFFLGNL